MKRILFAGAAVIATMASVALAQPAPPAGDGSVSVSELKQRETERFNAMDTNKDGQLSREELQAARPGPGMRGPGGQFGMRRGGPGQFGMGPGGPGGGPGMMRGGPGGQFGMRPGGPPPGGPGGPGGPGPLFEGADANHDGIVTQQEFTANTQAHFQQLDTNHDGKIDGNEAQAARGRAGGMMAGRRGDMASRMGDRRFETLDADHNGSVSRAEFDRIFSDRIARLDANHDGKITREERRAARPGPGRPGGPGGV